MTDQEKTAWIIQKHIPDREADRIYGDMETAYRTGFFDKMFCRECEPQMQGRQSKEILLESLRPGVSFPIRETFLKVYGYSVTDPEYAETVIHHLESLGCTDVRKTYEDIIDQFERSRESELKETLHRWFDSLRNGGVKKRETKKLQQELLQRKRTLLLKKQQLLKQNSQILTDSLLKVE